jgi:hypothetical protein
MNLNCFKGAAPKPEILIIPGANRSGEFELLGRFDII